MDRGVGDSDLAAVLAYEFAVWFQRNGAQGTLPTAFSGVTKDGKQAVFFLSGFPFDHVQHRDFLIFLFRAEQTERGWLSLDELIRTAREVGGDAHHFRAIQLPYNLAMPEAVTRSNQIVQGGKATALNAAKALGIAVSASASLLQGQLSRGLPPIVANAFGGLATDAQRSIQFVRSTPGVDVALVGMKSADHVRDTLETAAKPPATLEELMRLFKRGDEP